MRIIPNDYEILTQLFLSYYQIDLGFHIFPRGMYNVYNIKCYTLLKYYQLI